jgi:hypothetical protein
MKAAGGTLALRIAPTLPAVAEEFAKAKANARAMSATGES